MNLNVGRASVLATARQARHTQCSVCLVVSLVENSAKLEYRGLLFACRAAMLRFWRVGLDDVVGPTILEGLESHPVVC